VLRVKELLRQCVELDGSDLHIKTDTGKVYIRSHGDLHDMEGVESFTPEEFEEGMKAVLRPEQWAKFDEAMELDFALEVPGAARFRGNMFRQRGQAQAIFRVIPFDILTMEDLSLPELSFELTDRPRGLVLVTGPAGSGKSTSLAAMIDRINRRDKVHIVTVEDPVEFVHDDHVALINQRELDVDTLSFANALKYVLRQDPDVILVGEMRDLDTIHLAITAAETGHLVFGTLHTVDALQTVDRIVDVFPQHQQQQIRMQLSVNLLGVISQTLIPRKDGRGRVAAFEVLNATSAVRNLIRENKTYQIGSIIQTGLRQKMQTLDQSLARLVEAGIVELDVAKNRAKDPGEFMRIVDLTKKGIAAQKGYAPKSDPTTHEIVQKPPAEPEAEEKPARTVGHPNRPAAKAPGHPNRPAPPPKAEPELDFAVVEPEPDIPETVVPPKAVEPERKVEPPKPVEPEKKVEPPKAVEPEKKVEPPKAVEPERKVEPPKAVESERKVEPRKAVEPERKVESPKVKEPEKKPEEDKFERLKRQSRSQPAAPSEPVKRKEPEKPAAAQESSMPMADDRPAAKAPESMPMAEDLPPAAAKQGGMPMAEDLPSPGMPMADEPVGEMPMADAPEMPIIGDSGPSRQPAPTHPPASPQHDPLAAYNPSDPLSMPQQEEPPLHPHVPDISAPVQSPNVQDPLSNPNDPLSPGLKSPPSEKMVDLDAPVVGDTSQGFNPQDPLSGTPPRSTPGRPAPPSKKKEDKGWGKKIFKNIFGKPGED
jgi:twitching motility protein PilT